MKDIDEILKKCKGCINKPCQKGCPLNNNTTDFIKLMKEEKYKEAYELLCETTVLSPVCGRICPHEKQCQGSCIGRFKDNTVQIGTLEAYLGDLSINNNWKIPMKTNVKLNKKIAVVGGGPSGLTCSAFLAKEGFEVTIYEKHNSLGGILKRGIPEFRLGKEVLDKTIGKILELGIKVEYNKELGKDFTLEELEKKYDAIFLSFGKNISSKMEIEGEKLEGVYGANELLEYRNFPDFKDKKVAVIGGGNVAMDAARTAKFLGAKEVKIIYRRSKEEMPAEEKEIKDAIKEGIEFLFTTNILKVLGENKVEKIECIKTKLVQKEGEDRKYPVNIEDSNFYLDADYVLMAVGSKVEENLVKTLNLKTNKNGTILIDENNRTSRNKVFAGGDLANEKQTVAWASRSGRNAAESIIKLME